MKPPPGSPPDSTLLERKLEDVDFHHKWDRCHLQRTPHLRERNPTSGAVPLLSSETHPQSVHSLTPPWSRPSSSSAFSVLHPLPCPTTIGHSPHGNQWDILKTNHVRSRYPLSQNLRRASHPTWIKSQASPLGLQALNHLALSVSLNSSQTTASFVPWRFLEASQTCV